MTGVCVVSTEQGSQCGCQLHCGLGNRVCLHGDNICAAKPIFLLKQKNYTFCKKKKGGGYCPLNGDGLVCKISSGFNYFLILFNVEHFL